MYFVHPQIEKKKILKSFSCFFQKTNLKEIKEKLAPFFPEKELYFVDMARTAFRIIVEKLNLRNSQILMPAFICDVFYPILKEYNIKPIFLDIDLKTFHIKLEKIKDKISENTKAILICHTFGLPMDIDNLFFELKTSNIFVIEDAAHAFFAKYKNSFVGNFGTVSFFSLYKQFPMARGGLLVCPKDWKVNLRESKFNLRDFISFLNSISSFAFLFKKFGQKIAPRMMRGEKKKEFLAINNVSLNLFSLFLNDFEKNLEKRKNLALFYQESLKELGFEVQEEEGNIFCYLSALVPKNLEGKRDKIVKELQKRRIFCTRIWKDPIILNKKAQNYWKINPKDYPNTLEAAKRIINFPLQSHYHQEDIKKIIFVLKKILNFLK